MGETGRLGYFGTKGVPGSPGLYLVHMVQWVRLVKRESRENLVCLVKQELLVLLVHGGPLDRGVGVLSTPDGGGRYAQENWEHSWSTTDMLEGLPTKQLVGVEPTFCA